MFIDGLGLLECEALRPIRINPSCHPRGGSHQVFLRFQTRYDGTDISRSPWEVVLDESVDIRVLKHHVL